MTLAGSRKRIRKRKRRAVSSSASSSSSSSSSSSDSDSDSQDNILKKQPSPPPERIQETSESDSSSETDSDAQDSPAQGAVAVDQPTKTHPSKRRPRSPSPPPPPRAPSFVPPAGSTEHSAQDQMLRDRFRKFWMASVADAFKDDLEEIRKEPNLTTARLALLIDSLASGADVFAPSSHRGEEGGINEMEVVLDSSTVS